MQGIKGTSADTCGVFLFTQTPNLFAFHCSDLKDKLSHLQVYSSDPPVSLLDEASHTCKHNLCSE